VALEQIPQLADLFHSVVSLEHETTYEKEAATAKAAKKNEATAARGTEIVIEEGQRNIALAKLAGTMRRRDMSEEAIFAALKVENEAKCNPPLPEAEVRTIAKSIGRYKAKEPVYEPSDLTAFPTEALPRTLRKFVEEAAASIGCPPAYLGVPMLATLASAIGNSRVLEVKTNYSESATLYTAIIGDPGSSKTPALNLATAPASKKQQELEREYREALAQYNRENRRWEDEIYEDFTPDPPQEPVYQRTVVQDITVEALTERLVDNPRGLLSNNDEISGWVRSMDQYKGGKGNDRQFWLSTWSNNPIFVDRKGRKDPLMVPRSFVAIVGGIQPGILSELKNDREDGLLDRFLFSFPDPLPTRWSDTEISEETMAAYEGIYEGLYGFSVDTDENRNPSPRLVTFTPQAKRVFIDAYDSLSEEMESPDFPQHLKGPWSKMRSYLARISLIIGMARIAEMKNLGPRILYDLMPPEAVISESDVKAAVVLIEYFKSHACKVYTRLHNQRKKSTSNTRNLTNADADKGTDLAQYLVQFLRDRDGYWQGMTSQLYEICKAASVSGLPGGDGAFGKQVRKIANAPDNDLVLNEGWRGKDPIIKLSLSTVGTVGGVGSTHTETTKGTDSRNEGEKATTDQPEPTNHKDYLAEIRDAVERLFNDHPEHGKSPDTEAIAVELFWWGYLNYIPDERDVEVTLCS